MKRSHMHIDIHREVPMSARLLCVLAVAWLAAGCSAVKFNDSSWDPFGRYMSQGQEAFHHGKADQAVDAFSKAIELAPARADAWNARAFVEMRTGHGTEAITDFQEAVRRDAGNALYVGNLGVAYLEA